MFAINAFSAQVNFLALTLFAADSPSNVRFLGGGAMELRTNISPPSVCTPAIAIQLRADNALLTNQILWE